MFSRTNVSSRDLKSQLDEINKEKRQILIDSQHFEKIKALTKDRQELQNLEHKVMKSRQKFLQYSVDNF
ncbi:ORF-108 [Catopsilia pomona nucleopolyhedrovirus]|uniref:ORF-108 n=1 Tax=Catopsilia pomona nucleopolyhedrovirus TaxID=1850906 RepID=A0A172WZI0_9ABAC|nr:ORF-108 [Catopsilia pomona nucleopolyhedrovirus]ANF29756.1 ORF-108 [Catopsilia pomona nucleopolyhedrovirus]